MQDVLEAHTHKRISHAIPGWDGDLRVLSGRGDLSWALSEGVIYVDIVKTG